VVAVGVTQDLMFSDASEDAQQESVALHKIQLLSIYQCIRLPVALLTSLENALAVCTPMPIALTNHSVLTHEAE
jgi:hypothetical protein